MSIIGNQAQDDMAQAVAALSDREKEAAARLLSEWAPLFAGTTGWDHLDAQMCLLGIHERMMAWAERNGMAPADEPREVVEPKSAVGLAVQELRRREVVEPAPAPARWRCEGCGAEMSADKVSRWFRGRGYWVWPRCERVCRLTGECGGCGWHTASRTNMFWKTGSRKRHLRCVQPDLRWRLHREQRERPLRQVQPHDGCFWAR